MTDDPVKGTMSDIMGKVREAFDQIIVEKDTEGQVRPVPVRVERKAHGEAERRAANDLRPPSR